MVLAEGFGDGACVPVENVCRFSSDSADCGMQAPAGGRLCSGDPAVLERGSRRKAFGKTKTIRFAVFLSACGRCGGGSYVL